MTRCALPSTGAPAATVSPSRSWNLPSTMRPIPPSSRGKPTTSTLDPNFGTELSEVTTFTPCVPFWMKKNPSFASAYVTSPLTCTACGMTAEGVYERMLSKSIAVMANRFSGGARRTVMSSFSQTWSRIETNCARALKNTDATPANSSSASTRSRHSSTDPGTLASSIPSPVSTRRRTASRAFSQS